MSYSRWSDSRWYTFYPISSDFYRDLQFFEICSVVSFTYKQIKADIDDCLAKALREEPEATEEDMLELRGYMERFMKSVESNSKLNAFDNLVSKNDLTSFVQYAEEHLKKYSDDEDLKEVMSVINTPFEKLPLLVNTLDSDAAIEVLHKRLSKTLP